MKEFPSLDKFATIGITNLLSNITTKPDSHKGGWARLLKCQLHCAGYRNVKILDSSDKLNDFDYIIFDLGAEYSGAINMFGGLDEKTFNRLYELRTYPGLLYSWKHSLPDLRALESRRTNESTCEQFKKTDEGFMQSIYDILLDTEVFDHVEFTDKLLIGDSHTPGVWARGYMIERRDGRSLEGMFRGKTIKKYIDKFSEVGVKINELHVHAGSIDVRHHWCREKIPAEAVTNAILKLKADIASTGVPYITLTHTMGIEDESRKLPQTGFFKGTPFYGSWEERNKLREIFNASVDYLGNKYGWDVVKYPTDFFDETGKLKFDVMEKPQSVHISPSHYRTNLDNGKERW